MSFFNLRWRPPYGLPSHPPSPLRRTYFQTSFCVLELIYFSPSEPSSSPPILFAHGGYGSASVWYEYMLFFALRNIPCYAVSYRGHGNSAYPSFLRMVYGTTKGMLASDLVASVKEIERLESERHGKSMKDQVILVGHSSGGGLAQYILSEGMVNVRGLALLGSVPGFGSIGVYANWWFRVDPFFMPRVILHLWHPTSPLSTDELVKNVFFSAEKPVDEVTAFRLNMAPYESYWWPMSMMWRFTDPQRVLRNINRWNEVGIERLLVLVGSKDVICTPSIMEQLTVWFRLASESLLAVGRLDVAGSEVKSVASSMGVRFDVVQGAGHHLQNDVKWEDGAVELLDFYQYL